MHIPIVVLQKTLKIANSMTAVYDNMKQELEEKLFEMQINDTEIQIPTTNQQTTTEGLVYHDTTTSSAAISTVVYNGNGGNSEDDNFIKDNLGL